MIFFNNFIQTFSSLTELFLASVELKHTTVTLLEPYLLENFIHDNASLDAADVMEIKEANLSLTHGEKYVVLVNPGKYASVSKEARELSASHDFAQNTLAKALLVNSLPHRLISQFYIKVNRPRINTRIFADRDKALEWLREQLASSETLSRTV
jgi:hypothetical protein